MITRDLEIRESAFRLRARAFELRATRQAEAIATATILEAASKKALAELEARRGGDRP